MMVNHWTLLKVTENVLICLCCFCIPSLRFWIEKCGLQWGLTIQNFNGYSVPLWLRLEAIVSAVDAHASNPSYGCLHFFIYEPIQISYRNQVTDVLVKCNCRMKTVIIQPDSMAIQHPDVYVNPCKKAMKIFIFHWWMLSLVVWIWLWFKKRLFATIACY